jgi:DNA invertase Pin-like site-specific DNA recombinase
MSKTIAYIRASTDKQDLNNQKLEILEFARKKDVKIDEFVEITISSRKTSKQRRIDEVLERLGDSDTLVVTELSRLGRSTPEVIALINQLIARTIRVIIIKQNLDIHQHDMNSKIVTTLFSLFAELERDLISLPPKKHWRQNAYKGSAWENRKARFRKVSLIKMWTELKSSLSLAFQSEKSPSCLATPIILP